MEAGRASCDSCRPTLESPWRSSAVAPLLIVAVALVLLPDSAAAAPGPRVAIELVDCKSVDEAEIRRVALLELRAHLAFREDADATRARIRCQGGTAALLVSDPVTGKTSERHVGIAGLDASIRARSLALALAELVLASWTEVRTNPEPTLRPLEAKASPTARQATERVIDERAPPPQPEVSDGPGEQSAWRVGIGGCSLLAFESPIALWGGQVEGSWQWRRWTVGASAGYLGGQTRRLRGSVTSQHGSFGVWAGPSWATAPLRWSLLVGVQGGPAALQGRAADGGTEPGRVDGLLAGPVGAVQLIWPTRRFERRVASALGARLATGYAASGVRGFVAGGSDVALSGGWVALSLFFALQP